MRGLLIVGLVVAGSCGAPARAFAPSDDQAIRGVIAAQAAAWNRGDLEAFMTGYARSAELVFTSGGTIRRGYDDTLAKYRATYGEARATMGALALEVLSIQHLGADGAIVLGRWTLTNTPNAGGGVFSLAFDRTSAGWRIVHDHTSARP